MGWFKTETFAPRLYGEFLNSGIGEIAKVETSKITVTSRALSILRYSQHISLRADFMVINISGITVKRDCVALFG